MRLLRKVEGTGMLGVMSVEVRSHIASGSKGVIASKTKSVDVEVMMVVVSWWHADRTAFEGGECY